MISASMPRLPADPAVRLAAGGGLQALLAALVLWLPALPAAALESDRHQDMTIESDTSESDIERGVVRLSGNVTIEQGSLRIEAGSGEIHQDRDSGAIARVILEGEPARMEQALDNAAGHMRASARRIDYDAARDQVVLSGDVRIVEPRGTMTGQQVSYDIARGSIRGQSGAGGDRVRLVLPGRRAAEPVQPPPDPDTGTDTGTDAGADVGTEADRPRHGAGDGADEADGKAANGQEQAPEPATAPAGDGPDHPAPPAAADAAGQHDDDAR